MIASCGFTPWTRKSSEILLHNSSNPLWCLAFHLVWGVWCFPSASSRSHPLESMNSKKGNNGSVYFFGLILIAFHSYIYIARLFRCAGFKDLVAVISILAISDNFWIPKLSWAFLHLTFIRYTSLYLHSLPEYAPRDRNKESFWVLAKFAFILLLPSILKI